MSDGISYADAINSHMGLRRFAAEFDYSPSPTLRHIAFSRQIAEMLDNPQMRQYCTYHADQALPGDEYECALQALARLDKQAMSVWMKLPGHIGWHTAARQATLCYMDQDAPGLDAAVLRLHDYYGVDTSIVDATWEIDWASMRFHALTQGQWQQDKRRESLMRLTDEMLGRAMLDIAYEDWRITYGRRVVPDSIAVQNEARTAGG